MAAWGMTSKREKFFRQRVFNKLFLWEHEIETDSDNDDHQGNIEKETSARTENAAIHEALDKGQKRKQNEAVEESGQSSASYSPKQNFPEKRVLTRTPGSEEREQQGLLTEPNAADRNSVQSECEGRTSQETGSQSTESSEQASRLSKNQKRKMKKKRHKKRMRSGRTQQTNLVPKEFTYETG